MLTVAAVARRLGVAPSTLRTWDRRYGLGPSAHTAGSHRRYSASDLARLVVMRRLTGEGVPPAEAAQIAATSGVPGPAGPPAPTPLEAALQADDQEADLIGGPLSSAVGPWADSLVLGIPAARTGPEQSGSPWQARGARPNRSGGGRVVALPDGSRQARGLARAAMSLDTVEVSRLLRDAIRGHGCLRAWDGLAMPVLRAMGERWTQTGDGVEVEHAFAEAVVGVFHGVTGALHRARNTRPVLLACAEGDYHTLPLHALAAALAEEEVGCRLLGVGMPADALVAAVRRSGPAVVFLYARLATNDVEVLDTIRRQRPAPRLVVGGPGWRDGDLPPSAVRVGSLVDAVEEVISAAHL
jgi:DNA-binding transcriptional MerR regulator/methanogenic corrinoid protein MtbC1